EGIPAPLPPHRVGRQGGDASSAPSPSRGEARRGYQLRSLPTAWGGQEGMPAQLPPHRVGRPGGDASSAPSPSRGEARRGYQLRYFSLVMATLPLSVAPSSTVSLPTRTSPLSLPDPPRVRRRLALTLPLTWPRTETFPPSIVAETLAVDSTATSPLTFSSPSTVPWMRRSPWISRRPCSESCAPSVTTLVPPF